MPTCNLPNARQLKHTSMKCQTLLYQRTRCHLEEAHIVARDIDSDTLLSGEC
jgi:hypothetical protein